VTRWQMGARSEQQIIKDDCTRECPAIEVDFSRPGERVGELLNRVARERGLSDILVVDNGPALRGRSLDAWADDSGVRHCFIDPGKPTQTACIESFNGRFRPFRQIALRTAAGSEMNVSTSIVSRASVRRAKSSKTGGSIATLSARTAA
jgi:transposase InsO family protein